MSLIAHIPLINDTKEKFGRAITLGSTAPTSGVAGKVGPGYSFKGNTATYVKCDDLKLTPEMSFALWVKFNAVSSCFLLDCRSSNSGYQPLYYNTDSGIQFYSSGTKTGGYVATGALAANTWYHLVATIKNDVASVYLNGVLKGTVNASGLTLDAYATIGLRHSLDSGPANAIIQDVRIYNHALSLKEIRELNKALLLHYNFEDNFGTTNLVSSPNSWTNTGVYTYDGSGQSAVGTHVAQSDGSILITDSKSNTRIQYMVLPAASKGEAFTVSIKYKLVSGDQTFRWQIQELNSASAVTRTWWTHEKDATSGNPAAKEFLLDKGWKIISYRFTVENANTTKLRFWLQDGADNTTYTHSYYLKDFKVEKGHVETPNFASTTTNVVTDISGHGLNGTNNGVIYRQETNLGQHCSYYTNGKQWISRTGVPAAADRLTVSLWFKSSNTSPLSGYHIPFTIDSGTVEISIPGSSGYMRWGGYTTNNGRVCSNIAAKDANGNTVNLLNGQWHHIVSVYDGTGWLGYTNGQYIGKHAATGTITYGSKVLTVGRYYNDATSNYGNTDAYMSDVRIYNSALTAEDIKTLYRARKEIDKNGNIYVRALNEIGQSNSQILSTGAQRVSDISEIIHLNDRSVWMQISHHDNRAGTNLFSSSDPFETEFVYHNKDCWAAFNLIKSLGPYNGALYEFMAMEQLGTTDNFVMRRWAQKISPFDATYNTVSPGHSNVIHIENMPSMNGGMYKLNSSTYFCVTNASNGNWYGAFGSWTKYSAGIPTFNNSSTAGIFDLYIRIDPAIGNKYREFPNGVIMPNQIYVE